MAGPPFEVELLLGGATVPFKLPEEAIQASRNPMVRAIVMDGGRESFRRAAYEIVYKAVVKNEAEPVTVDDGDTSWLIPTRSIQAARLRDPSQVVSEQRFGFRPDRKP